MQGLLQKIDAYIESKSLPAPPAVDTTSHADVGAALQHLDLTKSKIRTVIWATGYERRYPWLTLPVLDDRGEIRHEGGVTPEEGLFVMGMRFQRTKGSNLIDGVAADAEAIATHLANRSSALHAA